MVMILQRGDLLLFWQQSIEKADQQILVRFFTKQFFETKVG